MTERLYEAMFLFDANESAKDWSALETLVGALLSKYNARVEYSERWPDQRLATEIKGAKKGTYYLVYFHGDPQSIAEMRRDAELSEKILRLLIIREDWLEQCMNERREAAQRRADQEKAAPAPAAATESAEGEAGAAAEAAPAAAETATAVAEAPESKPEDAAESKE